MLAEVAVAVFCLKVVRYCMYMWLPMYLLNAVSMRERERERERKRERMSTCGYLLNAVSMCVCVRERERERVHVATYVPTERCERERE